jgi:hypothetical protein
MPLRNLEVNLPEFNPDIAACLSFMTAIYLEAILWFEQGSAELFG